MAVEEQKIPKELVPKLEKFKKVLKEGIGKGALPILLPQEILGGVPEKDVEEILARVPLGLFSTPHLIKFLEESLRKKKRDIRRSHELLSAIFAAALTNFENQEKPIRKIGEEIGAEEIMKNIEEIVKEKGEIPEKAKETLEKMGVETIDNSYKLIARQNLYTVLFKIFESSEEDELAKLLNKLLEEGNDEKYLMVKKVFESITKKLGVNAEDIYKVKDGKVEGNYDVISKVRGKLIERLMNSMKELEGYEKWKEVIDFYRSL